MHDSNEPSGSGKTCWCLLVSASLLSLFGCQQEYSGDLNAPHPPFCGTPEATLARCPRPWLPYLDQVPLGGVLELKHPYDVSIQVGISRDLTRWTPEVWVDDPKLSFSSLGLVKVFVKTPDYTPNDSTQALCGEEISSHIYEVVNAFDPQASHSESEAISMDDPDIIAWGEEIIDVQFGEEVSAQFQDIEQALGPAEGNSLSVLSLGRGGQITFYFEEGIANGRGADFAIFENSFSDFFLELAVVEVSTDGQHFTALPHAYLGEDQVSAFGEHDPRQIFGLAGKYIAGYGTPFDLSTLAWSPDTQSGALDLHAVHYVRVIDIIGDGTQLDSFQHPIYDPYPTRESAGVDLDAISVFHSPTTSPCP